MDQYNLGAVGMGHWFERLYTGMKESQRIKVSKAAGVNGPEGKLERLKNIGLDASNYYQFEPYKPIPQGFFDNLDIVHISDPNEFHASQTKQALGEGKITVTEKTWGVNRDEFYDVTDYIGKNGYDRSTYLHLHYVHKILTMELEELLKRFTAKYGKIRAVSTTFFEDVREGDMRRKGWLFSKANGGLFMDWIHPFEILYFGAKADRMKLTDIEPYAVNTEYNMENATGIHAEVEVSGRYFSDKTTAFIRIAKGASQNKKSARFVFESGAHLDLNYLDSEAEFTSNQRGTWIFYEDDKEVESGNPQGPTTSEILVKDMIGMCEGRKTGFSVDDAVKIFEPQWDYQSMIASKSLRANKIETERFVRCGLSMATDSCIIAPLK